MAAVYAASVEDILYVFRYSPLGILEGNVRIVPDRGAHRDAWHTGRNARPPCRHGVRLYESLAPADEPPAWRPVPGPGTARPRNGPPTCGGRASS